MTDPLFRMLAALPPAEPEPARADRVRARCRAILARQTPHRRKRNMTPFWAPLLAGLGGVYLGEAIRQALHLYWMR